MFGVTIGKKIAFCTKYSNLEHNFFLILKLRIHKIPKIFDPFKFKLIYNKFTKIFLFPNFYFSRNQLVKCFYFIYIHYIEYIFYICWWSKLSNGSVFGTQQKYHWQNLSIVLLTVKKKLKTAVVSNIILFLSKAT